MKIKKLKSHDEKLVVEYEVGNKASLKDAKFKLDDYNEFQTSINDEKERLKIIGDFYQPKYEYEIGDEVKYYIDKLVIVEVIDKNIYLTNNNKIYNGFELFPYNDKLINIKIDGLFDVINYSKCDISNLRSKVLYFGCEMSNECKMSNINQQLLIRDIFKGKLIGTIIFKKLSFKKLNKRYRVISGEEKLNTIILFMLDQLECDGVKYSDLDIDTQAYFENFTVSFGTINENVSDEVVDKIIIELNK